MKPTFCCILLLTCPAIVTAQSHAQQQGTIVRMRMTDCPEPQHSFMATMSGGARPDSGLQCPEYVLLSDKVVYVITGKNSEELLPLAEVTRFRFQKNEMLIRIDDAAKESHFHIKAMIMRQDWDRNEKLQESEEKAMISRHLDPAVMRDKP
jgi:hypothetical protein